MDMNLGEILFNPAQVPSGHLWPDGDTRLPDAAPGPASSEGSSHHPHVCPALQDCILFFLSTHHSHAF